MDEKIAASCEFMFNELLAMIKDRGRVTATSVDNKPYLWETDELEYGHYTNFGPFHWIKTLDKVEPPIYVHLRPDKTQPSIGRMQRIDFRHGDDTTLAFWYFRIRGQSK